jgi:aryl-alcohol dehydrogenase-like predicted oxidoreductase
MDGRPNAIKTFAAYSLQRMGLDVIDLYQPARADPSVPFEETIGAVADLITEGKVRFLGVSEITVDQLRRAHRTYPVAALEVQYSLASRAIETTTLPVARELGIGIVAWGVVAQGLLAGPTKGIAPPDDLRSAFPHLQGENLVKNLETVGFLEEMGESKDHTPAQLALAWVLSRGDDIVPLIGTSRRTRIQEYLRSIDISLSADELAALDRVFVPGAIIAKSH